MPRTLIEPFRIKSVEPIRMTTREERERILAVDLQAMAPLEGVRFIKGDITRPSTLQAIVDHFQVLPRELSRCDARLLSLSLSHTTYPPTHKHIRTHTHRASAWISWCVTVRPT